MINDLRSDIIIKRDRLQRNPDITVSKQRYKINTEGVSRPELLKRTLNAVMADTVD
jgi:hypothetical protein